MGRLENDRLYSYKSYLEMEREAGGVRDASSQRNGRQEEWQCCWLNWGSKKVLEEDGEFVFNMISFR